MHRFILLLFLFSNIFVTAQNVHDKLKDHANAVILEIGDIGDFHNGYAIYRKGERYGIMDRYGKDFISLGKFSFSKLIKNGGFYNGMCLVQDVVTEKFGAIDSTGKLVVPCIYHSMSGYVADGYTYADDWESGYHGYFIDKKGNRYARPDFYHTPSNELFFLIKQTYQHPVTTVFRKNGVKVFSMDYNGIEYSDGYFKVHSASNYNNNQYGFVDTTGKLVIPLKFSGRAETFQEGLALYTPQFQDEYYYSFINKSGEEAFRITKTSILSNYQHMGNFIDGYADCAVVKDGKSQQALIDKKGKTIVLEELFKQGNPQIVSDIYGRENTWGSIDFFRYNGPGIKRNSKGVYVSCAFYLKPNTVSANSLASGKMEQSGGVGGKDNWWKVRGIGFIDYNGELLVPPVFSAIGPFDEKSGLAKATYNYYNNDNESEVVQGFINTKGEFVIVMKDILRVFN